MQYNRQEKDIIEDLIVWKLLKTVFRVGGGDNHSGVTLCLAMEVDRSKRNPIVHKARVEIDQRKASHCRHVIHSAATLRNHSFIF